MSRIPDFAAYPRARLTLQWNRRQLLSALTTELRVRSEFVEGGAHYRLPDLGLLPDDLVELLTPVMITHLDPSAYGLVEPSPAWEVVRLSDGRHTLGAIAEAIGRRQGWDAELAFAFTRGVFLYLVTFGACIPRR